MQIIKTLLVFLLFSLTAACANDRFVLHYDSPANDQNKVNRGKGKTPTKFGFMQTCLLYTSPSPRDRTRSRMPSSA